MPRINQYSENATIENDDKVLTYDTQAAATKITPFSTIWNWIVSKLHALTSSSAALTPSTDRVLMDKNGTMTRVEPAAVAKYGIETYNGSTIAGQAQTVKSALDSLNSNLFVDGMATLDSTYIDATYVNTVARIGKIAFVSLLLKTKVAISSNTSFCTLPYTALYRADLSITETNGAPISDGYVAANSNVISVNGSNIGAGINIKVMGWYIIK